MFENEVKSEYHSTIKRNKIVPLTETWMDLETVVQSEVSQKKNKYCVLMHICGIWKKNGTDEPIYKGEIEAWISRTNV